MTIDQQIATAAARIPGLELIRVARAGGRCSAVFEARPCDDYAKYISTPFYENDEDMLSTVLDTLGHVNGDEVVNIFSSGMFEFLCAEMLPADGRPISLTIKSVAEEKVAGPRGEELKISVTFVERPKRLILNKTNARAIARALGPETDNWRGATVALGVESVKVGREIVPAIRVKAVTAAARSSSRAPAAGAGDSDAGQGAAE